MRRFPDATAAFALLLVLFAVSLPQVSNFVYPALGEAVAKLQSEENPLVGRTVLPSAAPDGVSVQSRLSTETASPGLGGDEEDLLPSESPAPSDAAPSGSKSTSSPVTAISPKEGPSLARAMPSEILPPVVPTPTQAPLSPTPTVAPPPPVNPAPKHIALQAGHWKYKEAPSPLNTMTGSSGGGKTEPEVTLAIANEVARILRSLGHTVTILPTVIPSGFKADLVLSIHTDGSTNAGARGFFTDRPVGSPVTAAEARLSAAIDQEYARVTGIPYVYRSTPGSRYYYGYREVAASVPMVLIETGFLTNAIDQEILIKQPQKSAEGIANGIKRYLSQ